MARLPCPSPTPGACSDSCPWNRPRRFPKTKPHPGEARVTTRWRCCPGRGKDGTAGSAGRREAAGLWAAEEQRFQASECPHRPHPHVPPPPGTLRCFRILAPRREIPVPQRKRPRPCSHAKAGLIPRVVEETEGLSGPLRKPLGWDPI